MPFLLKHNYYPNCYLYCYVSLVGQVHMKMFFFPWKLFSILLKHTCMHIYLVVEVTLPCLQSAFSVFGSLPWERSCSGPSTVFKIPHYVIL